MLRQPDEGALSKLLIEVVLLECTGRAPTSDPDLLIATSKRHRVDVEKLRKAVEQEFTAKRAKLAPNKRRLQRKVRRRPQRSLLSDHSGARQSTIARAPFYRWKA